VSGRDLHVPEVRNVRDLGGLGTGRGPIRSGLFLRAAALHELTAEGADVLADLGLRTVIDLRMAVERELEPSRVREHARLADVAELRMPLVSDFEGCPDSPDGSYRYMAERGAPAIGAVLTRLAEPGALPALVHCTAGKDRTGIVVAALLSTLGVPIEQIHADYLWSNETLGDRLIYPAEAWALDAALARMAESAGSIENFLERHGVSGEALSALHLALLDGI
jgi:protein-tyrosine phosphatase